MKCRDAKSYNYTAENAHLKCGYAERGRRGVCRHSLNSASGVVREKLDELFDTAIANIMALEIRKSSRTIITDAMTGAAITAQFKAIGEVTATTSSTKFEDADGSKISYNMTKAKNAVQAYMDALLGTADTWVQANNAPAGANNRYNNGNSEIFKWYNSIVLGNSYGYAKVTVNPS